jgi:hypothetical protein
MREYQCKRCKQRFSTVLRANYHTCVGGERTSGSNMDGWVMTVSPTDPGTSNTPTSHVSGGGGSFDGGGASGDFGGGGGDGS